MIIYSYNYRVKKWKIQTSVCKNDKNAQVFLFLKYDYFNTYIRWVALKLLYLLIDKKVTIN